ncbi:putative uncharacterized protein DDB_G0286901 [Teleopsis dalmanni]|nr:putative uncharacterized protein DDB_G0286901 [Teleopsis dalmanni]
MTEFSTNNDINNKSHLSQPLQNSPRHFQHPTHFNHNQQKQHQNSPQHIANINKHLTHALKQNFNNKNNQQTLPLNSSANINNKNVTLTSTASAATTATNSPTSAIHSPLHTYRNPLNSPNNSPFAYAYYDNNIDQQLQQQQQQHPQQQQQSQQQQHTKITSSASSQQLQLLQQHLRSTKLPILTQTHYQQHLNDLLLQQQHLQQQQQQLLNAKDADDELSEESLKQNVAIVLNNLDRYNNALRSIILNEEVSSSSSVFLDDSFLIGSSGNNNFLLNSGTTMAAPATPESDYNSNATTPGSRSNMLPHDSNMLTQQHQQQHLVGFATTATACGGGVGNNIISNGIGGFCSLGNNVASNNLNCSLASSHDFTHDNSDYQWFLDYGYRDGCGGMQRSVLSSLSASYNGIGDLIYYEDIAKNLDANLAEVDMESFRAEDMHSLLYLPSYCKGIGGNSRLQQSLMLQQNMLPQITQHGHNISQTSTTSTNELIDNSICKSELLFSPVKESHISVDSLDMDAYPEDGDIILTCQANKDNYTIAFEGSVLYSDDSFYAEPNDIALKNKQNCINLHNNLDDIVKRKSLDVSMSRSEQQFTPRNKLQKSSTIQLQR